VFLCSHNAKSKRQFLSPPFYPILLLFCFCSIFLKSASTKGMKFVGLCAALGAGFFSACQYGLVTIGRHYEEHAHHCKVKKTDGYALCPGNCVKFTAPAHPNKQTRQETGLGCPCNDPPPPLPLFLEPREGGNLRWVNLMVYSFFRQFKVTLCYSILFVIASPSGDCGAV
jgi:hypothetical protein